MGIIGSIRKHSWIAVLVVGIAIVCFIIGDLSKNNRQQTFAKIDGAEMTYDYFSSRVNAEEENLQRYGYSSYTIKELVWQELVQEQLFGEEMQKLGINVSKKEMNDMFTGTFIPRTLQQQFTNPQTGVYDVEYVRSLITQLPQLPDTMEFKQQWVKLEQAVKKERQQEKYINLLRAGMYMPKAIAKQIADINSQAKDVRVAAVRYAQATDMDVKLGDADYQNYFNKHQKEINANFFRGDNHEVRNVTYAVFTAQPSQEDMAEIQNEVNEMWQQLQTLEGTELKDFVNMHGIYDTMYYKSDIFAAPLDSIISHSRAGSFIEPQAMRAISKQVPSRYTYGEYVMGKVLGTEMRPDSLRASLIIIPNDNYNPQIGRTVAEAKHLCDSAMEQIRRGMPFEEAVRQFSADTARGGDQDWQLDGFYGMLNDDIIRNAVGNVFVYDMPEERGHFIVKVTGKTAPSLKYQVALVTKPIMPSNDTEKGVRDQANQFASQYTNCKAMMEGAQAQNINLRSDNLILMSDSLTGFANTREAIRWAFNDETAIGAVSGEVYQSDYSYIVVGLQDVYRPGKLTLDQVRAQIEPLVRMEKMGEMLAEKAEQAMANKDINAIATTMGTTVDTLTGITFRGYFAGYGLEPKANGAIAAKAAKSLVGPIKGASGVYVIQIDAANTANEVNDQTIETLCAEYQNRCRNDINYLPVLLQDKVKIVDNRRIFF